MSAFLNELPCESAGSREVRTVTEVVLSYPGSWLKPPGQLPPDGLEIPWLERLGYLDSPAGHARFAELRAGSFAAHGFPDAEPGTLRAISEFLALETMHDDRIEAEGPLSKERADLIGRALAGALDEPPGDDRDLRAWWEVGRTFTRLASPWWCRRFSERHDIWHDAQRREAEMIASWGQYPETGLYSGIRKVTSGMGPWLELIEVALGRELPPRALDVNHDRVYELVGIVQSIDNDLHSLTRDAESGWPNLVFSLARDHGTSRAEACSRAARMHARHLAQLRATERHMRAAMPEIGWWLDAVQHLLAGMIIAHRLSPRYAPLHRLEDGGTVRITLAWN